MITVVVLNPAVDVRYTIDHFQLNQTHRCSNYQKTAGGKGLNVSRVLKTIGHEVQATGFLGGKSGEFISAQLADYDIRNRFVPINEETRTCIAVLSSSMTQTEILESGPFIQAEARQQFLDRYRDLLENTEIVCASGSLPQGLDCAFYHQLIEEANKKGVRFILDTSGMALQKAIEAKPFLIKPNRSELEHFCGKELHGEEAVIEQAVAIHRKGIENVVVSLGAEGAILVHNEGIYKAAIPRVRTVNPVGSGDSMVAGLIHSMLAKMSVRDTLRYATACGIANAMEEETGKISLDRVHEILDKIDVQVLSSD